MVLRKYGDQCLENILKTSNNTNITITPKNVPKKNAGSMFNMFKWKKLHGIEDA